MPHFYNRPNRPSSRELFATVFQSAQISTTIFPLHVFHVKQKQKKKRYKRSLVKLGRREEGKRRNGVCETDAGAEISSGGARTLEEQEKERERIARRAKVPSKHGTGMTRNSAGAFQANVMRCEAINAPSTRLDLRLHRHGAYSAASNARLSSRVFKALLPARPIPLRTARRLFSSLRIISIYFPTPRPLHPRSTVLPSHPPPPDPRQRVRTQPRPGMDLLALFRDLFSPRARRDLWRRVY